MFDRYGVHPDSTECAILSSHLPRNELVMRLQPAEAVYLKINVKTPGLTFDSTQSELDLSYNTRLHI